MLSRRGSRIHLALFTWAALLATAEVSAQDYRNLGENAIIYDGASRQASPQFILRKGTPVEVIVTVDKWSKVREVGGGLGWLEKAQLTDPRQVITTQASVIVRQQANEASPAAFSVAKDVLLDVIDKPGKGWIKVKHRDGQTGFVPVKTVWGI